MPLYRGDAKERRALSAYVKLIRASESAHAFAMRGLSEEGLTPTQFAVLEVLYHLGPLYASDIARKILKTGGNLTMVVSNLVRCGLVRRSKNAEDRRYVLVELTAKGRELMRRIFPRHAAQIVEAMGRLTPSEQKQLAIFCRKLGTSLTAK